MRRILLLVGLCGCASAGPAPARRPTILIDSRGVTLGDQPIGTHVELKSPPATVWIAARKAYADLGIPLTFDNPPSHQLGNPDFYRQRTIAGQAMTSIVDCGSGPEGLNASSYRIYMSLLTSVMPADGGGSTVETTLLPSGQDITEGSSDRIPCGTKGKLEQMVLDRIAANVPKS